VGRKRKRGQGASKKKTGEKERLRTLLERVGACGLPRPFDFKFYQPIVVNATFKCYQPIVVNATPNCEGVLKRAVRDKTW
jgi:hypothetical protein